MTFSNLWPALPLLLLGLGMLGALLVGAFIKNTSIPHGISLLAALTAAVAAILPPSNFSTTLGIATSDFARFFTVVFCIGAAVTLLLSLDYTRRHGIPGEEFPATVLFAAFGMIVTSAATNLLLLFLGLESLTFAFYFLVATNRGCSRSAEAGLKYLILGAVAAAFITFGLSFIYAASGTLEIAAAMAGAAESKVLALAGWGFFLTGIAFKISLVPLHLWTPDVYEGAPTPVAGFLSTGSKGAAFVALLLLLSAMQGSHMLRMPLWWLSLLSMIVGNLAALLQSNIKRMLAYSSIAQMGYVTLALLTGSHDGYVAVGLYVVFYTAMNLAAFGAIAVLSQNQEEEVIDSYRGAGYSRPFEAAVLAISMFALAGIPPSVGFVGKFAIFFAALKGGELLLAIAGILTAAASAYYYLRVVVALYMSPPTTVAVTGKASPREAVALSSCALFIILFGIIPAPLINMVASIIPAS